MSDRIHLITTKPEPTSSALFARPGGARGACAIGGNRGWEKIEQGAGEPGGGA